MDLGVFGVVSGYALIYHVGNLIQFFAFLMRDQLHLRVVLVVALLMQALFHLTVANGPDTGPLFWKILFSLTNVFMILYLFRDKLNYGIPADLRELYDKISVLSPGQFRKLAKISTRTSASPNPILNEGQMPDKLHYLLKGSAILKKAHSTSTIQAGAFLGEIAFLNNTSATATVALQNEALCVSWNSVELKSLMAKDTAIDIAMRGIFNRDLAAKVAKSVPINETKTAETILN